MASRGSHHVIRRQPPLRRGMFVVFVVAFFLWAMWMAFDFGRKRAGFDSDETTRQITSLELRLNQYKEDNRQLREKVAFLDHGKSIDRQAQGQVEKALTEQQAELSELKHQLNFYQSIVSPEEASEGVQVQTFAIEPGSAHGALRYKVTLIQGPARAKRVQGTLTISIEGDTEDGATSIGLVEFNSDKKPKLNYDFKYYQNFDGDIILPEDFRPERVVLRVVPKGRVRGGFEKSFDWIDVAPSP